MPRPTPAARTPAVLAEARRAGAGEEAARPARPAAEVEAARRPRAAVTEAGLYSMVMGAARAADHAASRALARDCGSGSYYGCGSDSALDHGRWLACPAPTTCPCLASDRAGHRQGYICRLRLVGHGCFGSRRHSGIGLALALGRDPDGPSRDPGLACNRPGRATMSATAIGAFGARATGTGATSRADSRGRGHGRDHAHAHDHGRARVHGHAHDRVRGRDPVMAQHATTPSRGAAGVRGLRCSSQSSFWALARARLNLLGGAEGQALPRRAQ